MCQKQESRIRAATDDLFAYKVVNPSGNGLQWCSWFEPQRREPQVTRKEDDREYLTTRPRGNTKYYELGVHAQSPFDTSEGMYAILFSGHACAVCYGSKVVLRVKIPKGTRYITGQGYYDGVRFDGIRAETLVPLRALSAAETRREGEQCRARA